MFFFLLLVRWINSIPEIQMEVFIDNYILLLSEILASDLTMYDSSFLKRTVESRMAAQAINTYPLYVQKLEIDENEREMLRRALNNSYSEFFRNPLTFDYLEYILLPSVYDEKKRRQEKEIRIWSAACASGQEAYSLAILCNELLSKKSADIKCRIFATDHCEDQIENARKGIYNMQNIGKVSLERFRKYFEPSGKSDEYGVISPLIAMIDFSVFDLLSLAGSSPPSSIYGNFDIVFCSNLLFYYKPDIQQLIFEKLDKNLNKEGFLATGEAEREIVKARKYSEIFPNSTIFQKR